MKKHLLRGTLLLSSAFVLVACSSQPDSEQTVEEVTTVIEETTEEQEESSEPEATTEEAEASEDQESTEESEKESKDESEESKESEKSKESEATEEESKEETKEESKESEETEEESKEETKEESKDESEESKESEETEEASEESKESSEDSDETSSEETLVLNQHELAEFDGQGDNKAYIAVNDVIYDVTDQELKDGHYGDYKVGVNTLYNVLLLGEDEALKDLPIVGVLEMVEETEEPAEEVAEEDSQDENEDLPAINQEELAKYDGQDGRKAYIGVNDVIYDVTDQELKDGYYGDYKVGVNTLYNSLLLGEDESLKDLPVVGSFEKLVASEEEEAVDESDEAEAQPLQDGTYIVTSSPNSKDEVIEQMITVEEGKITEAAFKVLHGEEEVALDEAEAQIVETLTKQFVDQGELLLPSEEGTPFIAYQLIANSEILRTLAQQGMSEIINLDEVEMKDSEYVVKDSFYEVTLKVENNEVKALEISSVSNEEDAEIVEKFIEEFMGVKTLDELTYVAAEDEDEETAQRNQAIYEHLKGLVNYAINLSKVQTIINLDGPVEEVEESSEEAEETEELEETSAEESSESEEETSEE
ncbi:hypothetical protein [Falseniella ignava]|uniref:Cytochrome b5 heme-binding domain-containing protein n=1 Tax=Falseniella ignava CCUG 37419 TaxID=883112 RepID=K1MP07_9LACT|nr:hypothetical protein [Falseniella ignava]EKB57909.1 hypothetical protein HMPREF9707_00369 [Falseniella ignava CCUG 37419]